MRLIHIDAWNLIISFYFNLFNNVLTFYMYKERCQERVFTMLQLSFKLARSSSRGNKSYNEHAQHILVIAITYKFSLQPYLALPPSFPFFKHNFIVWIGHIYAVYVKQVKIFYFSTSLNIKQGARPTCPPNISSKMSQAISLMPRNHLR